MLGAEASGAIKQERGQVGGALHKERTEICQAVPQAR